MSTLALDAIVIGERVRKDLGDLASLADSMRRHGLLHPVVVMPDALLVAGHRRIEAARLLGWTEIPVTIINVEDLLDAERDENEERKDFTPTEAVAIGRLIEAQHKAKIAAQKSAQMSRAGKISQAKWAERHGKSTGGQKDTPVAMPTLGTAGHVASKAVGMSEPTYFRAKAVVAAAESAPETFGDLPARMDETGQVLGAYTAMQARRGRPRPAKTPAPPAERLPVNSKTPHVKPAQVIQRTITALDGLCAALRVLDDFSLRMPEGQTWAQQVRAHAKTLQAFARRLDHEQDVAPAR